MGISVLNAPAAATGGGVNAQTFTASTSYTTYTVTDTFAPGGYTITTSPSNQQVLIYFASGTTSSSSVQTSSGTVSLELAFQATKCFIKDISGANGTVVTIEYTAESATQAAQTGTLDTITATGNYTQTGLLHVLAIGGGGGGGGGLYGGPGFGIGGSCAAGGAGGYSVSAIVYTNSTTAVTIGNGGNAGDTTGSSNNVGANAGNSGGTTNFGNLVSSQGGGGGGGAPTQNGARNGSQDGGSNVGANRGGSNNYQAGGITGGTSTPIARSITNGTNGGGGSGGYHNSNPNPGTGGGSGIGTGGTGAKSGSSPEAATAGTGYGAGGGGGSGGTGSQNGAAGSAGVIYVLRGI